MSENTNTNDAGVRLMSALLASAFVETCTLPLEVCKVKLQVESGVYTSVRHVFTSTVQNEGPQALFKGYAPTVFKQAFYTAFALVGYEPIRDLMCTTPLVKDGQAGFGTRLVAAGIAGGLGMAIMNPAEVVKTQIQSSAQPKKMLDVAKRIAANDGIRGFAAGIYPNVLRAFMIDAAVIGTYDHAKSLFVPYLGDNFKSQSAAGVASGVACAVIGTPVDVIKTRFMNQAGGKQVYSSMSNAAMTIYKEEGFRTLFSGFPVLVVRQPVWCIMFFGVYENTRKYMNRLMGKREVNVPGNGNGHPDPL